MLRSTAWLRNIWLPLKRADDQKLALIAIKTFECMMVRRVYRHKGRLASSPAMRYRWRRLWLSNGYVNRSAITFSSQKFVRGHFDGVDRSKGRKQAAVTW